jgi:alpha-beta hydrolase superfamily lysophospholipase
VPPDLASWYTERGFHFYVAGLRWPGRGHGTGFRRIWPRGGKALAAAFAELDATCEHLRTADGIDNVIVTAHGEGALAAALWCAAERPGGRADALILYAPAFSGPVRRGLDIPCPVLVIGGPGGQQRGRGWPVFRRRPEPAATIQLGRHVTWLRPTDGEARPDAREAEDRSRFFDEMGRWLGAYMYGEVRDQLL